MQRQDQKQVMREATRAGITNESIGEWLNSAIRFYRLGNKKAAAYCCHSAIMIHEDWGSRLDCYAMSPQTLEKAKAMRDEGGVF